MKIPKLYFSMEKKNALSRESAIYPINKYRYNEETHDSIRKYNGENIFMILLKKVKDLI